MFAFRRRSTTIPPIACSGGREVANPAVKPEEKAGRRRRIRNVIVSSVSGEGRRRETGMPNGIDARGGRKGRYVPAVHVQVITTKAIGSVLVEITNVRATALAVS